MAGLLFPGQKSKRLWSNYFGPLSLSFPHYRQIILFWYCSHCRSDWTWPHRFILDECHLRHKGLEWNRLLEDFYRFHFYPKGEYFTSKGFWGNENWGFILIEFWCCFIGPRNRWRNYLAINNFLHGIHEKRIAFLDPRNGIDKPFRHSPDKFFPGDLIIRTGRNTEPSLNHDKGIVIENSKGCLYEEMIPWIIFSIYLPSESCP